MALIREKFLNQSLWLNQDAAFVKSPELVNSKLYMGVELELEGCKYPLPDDPHGVSTVGDLQLKHHIRAHRDGSLRNGGIELVTPPLRGKELVDAVNYISELSTAEKWVTSNRAGLHIHVDVQILTLEQYMNLVKAYVLLEPCFFNAAGEERSGSIYCKSWYQHGNSFKLREILQMISQGLWQNASSRYFGFNINSTRKHGTIEFRHKCSTKSAKEILDWINIISKWYDWGLRTDITTSYVNGLTPDNLVWNVFGNQELMNSEFPSYFYHGCVPLWFDLFGPEVRAQLSWKKAYKQHKSHKGFEKFKARIPPMVPPLKDVKIPRRFGSIGPAFALSSFSSLEESEAAPSSAPEPVVNSYYNADLDKRVYISPILPPISSENNIADSDMVMFYAGRMWERSVARNDLYVTASTSSERERGAGFVVFVYGPKPYGPSPNG